MANNAVVNVEKETEARAELERYVKDCKIFIDTCSLIESNSELFWTNIIPFLHANNAKVIIPYRCYEEVVKHAKNRNDAALSQKADSCLKKMKQLNDAGYIDIRGEKTDNFADNVFLTVFTKFRMTHKLLLITNDRSLAREILNLNDSKAVQRAKMISVKRINKYGFLSELSLNEKRAIKVQKKAQKKDVPEEEKFEKSTVITSVPDTLLSVKRFPQAHDTVYVYTNQWNEIQLTEELGSGGEAVIYATNTPYVAKIYKKDKVTKRKLEKIRLMFSKVIKCEGICYPVAAVYSEKIGDQLVGFLMPKAKGIELQKGLFIKPLFQKNFPGWKKRDTVELCITILKKIQFLHDRNIIMGDINPANILVVSPKEVYFVDTDSYQIEGFPCPVGTVNYTAPEIQRKNFSNFLRTIGNENFAVATLLFMIMLPGKPPYSQQGGEDPIANIIKMDFSYPFGENSNKKTPDGPWRYIWSHLTYDIKEAFYNTFRKDGEHSTEQTRLSVSEWISLFEYYLELLDSGKFGKQDKMSEEIYPTRHKMNPKLTYIQCKLCHNEVPEDKCQNGMCRTCLNSGETYKCSSCGKEIVYTNYQKYIRQSKRYDICHECFEKSKQVKMRIRCADCGKTFDITNREYDFYRGKNMELPKRCKACRDKKRNQNTYNPAYSNNDPVRTQNTYTPSVNHSGRGSFCFLTTVVCEYYGKPDNCYELETLRNYRDNWLINQPGGKEQISEYYKTAPLIVSLLKSSEHYSEYCEKMHKDYIQPCLGLIAEKKYEECRELYADMFYYLRSELC